MIPFDERPPSGRPWSTYSPPCQPATLQGGLYVRISAHVFNTDSDYHTLALAVAETQRVRKYTIAGDVWWLTEQSLDPTQWAAWQYHVPHVGGTAVYFRRHKASSVKMKSGLRGISATNSSAAVVGEKEEASPFAACYSVQMYDEHYSLALNKTMTAAELQEHEVSLPQPATSMLLEYAVARSC